MNPRQRLLKIIELFEKDNSFPKTELKYQSVYELMVAVMLSAQCTDKRVNQITPTFFNRFPDFKSLAAASQEEVFEVIKSCSYPNNKARHLIAMARDVCDRLQEKIPDNIDELQKIPGIGRKSANVIAAVAFGKNVMPVDTHVFRVAQRIGLVSPSKTPLEVEKKLLAIAPEDKLNHLHHWLILHGRYVCQARKPRCMECKISAYCLYFQQHNF